MNTPEPAGPPPTRTSCHAAVPASVRPTTAFHALPHLPPVPPVALGLSALQATRHCGFKIWVLQYLFIFSVLFTMLALSLPIEGTDWAAQLAGWGATDWCLLALLGSLVYVGSNFAIQVRGPERMHARADRAGFELHCCSRTKATPTRMGGREHGHAS